MSLVRHVSTIGGLTAISRIFGFARDMLLARVDLHADLGAFITVFGDLYREQAKAATDLVTRLGGSVHALAFLIELAGLNGRDKLAGHTLHTVLTY